MPIVLAREGAETYGFPVTSEDNELEEYDVLTTTPACPHCTNTVLSEMKVTSRTAGRVTCDGEDCELTHCISEGTKYYGCKNCDEFDLCRTCYTLVTSDNS